MREKLIELVRDMRRKITAWHTTEDIADMLIANDVIPVVRCKDCKYWKIDVPLCRHEKSAKWEMDGDDFCSYGERKDNETV